MDLNDPIATALLVADLLERAGHPYALSGGLLLARQQSIRARLPDDFVVLKALETRDRDLDDAASVLRRSPDLIDITTTPAEVDRFAAEITDWDVGARWELIQERAVRQP